MIVATEYVDRRWLFAAALLVAVGAVAAVRPMVGIAIALAGVVAIALMHPRSLVRLFPIALFVLLAGYAFMGRGFAYIGVAPLFVGEVVLAIGVLRVVAARPERGFGWVQLVIVAFMAWGAVRTIPYVPEYGIDALRDAVSWAYAAFALVISVTLTARHVRTAIAWYRRVVPYLILWTPVFAVGWMSSSRDLFPVVPGTDVFIPFFKPGDVAVHLAGAAGFMLAGLIARRAWGFLREPLLWAAWLAGFAAVAALNRGGMLAVALSTAASTAFFRSLKLWLVLAATAAVVLIFLVASNFSLELGASREVSVGQLVQNAGSILGTGDDPSLSGTREWREEWWNKIIGYTIGGPYLWDGKGYGINLAESDGFLGLQFPGLRAPHNAHLQFLARSGVPGIVLWLAVLLAFFVSLVGSLVACRRAEQDWWVRVHTWILVYWIAALVNMTFDVYLEGPQGGIVFWSIVGLGLATVSLAKAEREAGVMPGPATSPERGTEAKPGRITTALSDSGWS